MYASLALLAPYLQTLMDYPVLTAGVVLAPRGAGLMVAALICGKVIGKTSARLLVGMGFIIGAYALHEMTLWTPDISEEVITAASSRAWHRVRHQHHRLRDAATGDTTEAAFIAWCAIL